MRRMIAIGMAVAATPFCQITFCQTAQTRPVFEVASVKPGGDLFSTKPERTVGRIRWTTQLCYLVGYAYHLDLTRLSGRSCGSVYSLEATFDPAATEDQVRLMVQSLLADRFKMQVRRVGTESDGYTLVVGKGGPKIRESKADDEPPAMPEWIKNASAELKAESFIAATGTAEAGVIAITGRRVSMSQLATTLERAMQMPVWDRTGLPGNFYFAFRYKSELTAEVDTDTPSLAAALQENLGLRLEKQKGLVETLVIDSYEAPSGN